MLLAVFISLEPVDTELKLINVDLKPIDTVLQNGYLVPDKARVIPHRLVVTVNAVHASLDFLG